MENYNDEVSFYIDAMIVETLSSNNLLVKNAQSENILNSLIGKIQNYVNNQIDPNNKVKSVLDILAPGAVKMLFSALGFGWTGTFLGLAMNIFHIDTVEILESAYEKIKQLLTNSQDGVSSAQIDNIVNSSVQDHASPVTQQEADEIEKKMQAKSNLSHLRDAKILKLALLAYNPKNKLAASSFLSIFSNKKDKMLSLLAKILGWIFKVVIGSAGLLVSGDVVNKFLNRPNAIDGTYQRGRTEDESTVTNVSAIPVSISNQTKFPINPSYHDEILNTSSSPWIINITNNESNIQQAILDFTKEVYKGLENQDSNILNSNKFNNIVDTITWYNRSSSGGPIVFIPKFFTSKKNLVDHFIDEVASKTT